MIGPHLGLMWDATIPLQISQIPAADLYGGASLALGQLLRLQVGAGATTTQVSQGDEERLVFAWQPHLGLAAKAGLSQSVALDLGLAGGWTPSTLHAQARAGAMGVSDRAISWFSGADFSLTRSTFEEVGQERMVHAYRWRLGLRVGAVFGRMNEDRRE
ncbi:MAG: hypothetical protein HN348_20985 [Proteobacteria bacterium]|nr:hypothetical protein [Pseudomonadota bacterium]